MRVRYLARRDSHGRAAVQQGQPFPVLFQLFGKALHPRSRGVIRRIRTEILRRLRKLLPEHPVSTVLLQHLRRDRCV